MEKRFAVIYFPAEQIYSEIPSSWLTADKEHCWWPNSSINARNLMIRCEVPDKKSWILHEIKLEAYASTLESARKKAENPSYITGGEDVVATEKRNRKPVKRTSSSECESEITPPPLLKQRKKKASKSQVKGIQLALENEGASQQNSQPSYIVLAQNVDNSASSHTISEEVYSVIDGHTVTTNETVRETEPSSHCTCKGDLLDLTSTVEKLIITCNTIQKYVVGINSRLKSITSEHGKLTVDELMDTLMCHLPLNSKDAIAAFDTIIDGKKGVKSTYVQFIKRIEGRDLKDHINRSLPKVFTNEVGKYCSYFGLRGNFKLQQFNFVRIFVDVMIAQYACSQHDVEKCVSEWFRLANQRQKRTEKTLEQGKILIITSTDFFLVYIVF